MTSKTKINRNADEWDLPNEIAEEILAAVGDIEAGEFGRITEIQTSPDGKVDRIFTQPDGTKKRETLNAATAARIRTGLSQTQFATLLGISKRTLQEWEQGRRQPSGAAQALLKIATARPDVVQSVLAG